MRFSVPLFRFSVPFFRFCFGSLIVRSGGRTSHVFPLDYLIFGTIVCYIFVRAHARRSRTLPAACCKRMRARPRASSCCIVASLHPSRNHVHIRACVGRLDQRHGGPRRAPLLHFPLPHQGAAHAPSPLACVCVRVHFLCVRVCVSVCVCHAGCRRIMRSAARPSRRGCCSCPSTSSLSCWSSSCRQYPYHQNQYRYHQIQYPLPPIRSARNYKRYF